MAGIVAPEKATVKRKKMLLSEETPFAIKEGYKALRTNIMFTLPEEGCKKILITSSMPSEGKSLSSSNIAIAFAQTKARILLIDCDFRKPTQASTFLEGGKEQKGLTNYLINDLPFERLIIKSGYENLDLIISGDIPPNPVELISSNRMKELIKTLETKYDYIIIDSPPVNVVTDAVLLSKLTDGVVLVVRQRFSEKRAIAKAVETLEFAGASILGCVMNCTGGKTAGSKHIKNKYGYGYGYGYGTEK